MHPIVENQLLFKSNRKTVLAYLKSKCANNDCLFTLNSIKMMPDQFDIELTEETRNLSILNVGAREIKGPAYKVLVEDLLNGNSTKLSPEELFKKIGLIKRKYQATARDKIDQAVFEKAVDNFENSGFFTYFDWRMHHWGVIDDVQSVDKTTFHRTTECIKFTTFWAPPLEVLNNLANTFPSVKFELLYRYQTDQDWSKIQLFPQVPFGY